MSKTSSFISSHKRKIAAFLICFTVSAAASSILSYSAPSMAMSSAKKTECSPDSQNGGYIYEEDVAKCAPEWVAERIERRKIINDPSRQSPPWLSDLADRFSIVANGLRLIKNKVEIDRWVGDPWTLRDDTRAQLDILGEKLEINMNTFLSNNLSHLFKDMEYETIPAQPSGSSAPTSLNNRSQPTLTFEMDEEMTRQLPNAVAMKTFKDTLNQEQMIDLAVYILSKAPFFPKREDPEALEKWEKIKHDIYYYDLYIILAAAAATTLTNTAQGSLSGWLFKFGGDTMRFGWIGKFRKVGIGGNGKVEGGFKVETENVKGTVTYYKDFSANEKQEIRASFVTQWFKQFFEDYQWNTSGGLNASYIMSDHANPASKGTSNIGATVYVHKSHLFNAHGPEFTGSGGVSYSSNNTIGGSLTAIVSDKRNGVSFTVSANSGEVGRPDGTVARDTRGTFLGSWTPNGGIDRAAKNLKNDAAALIQDMEIIKKAKETLAQAIAANSERDKESSEFWLESRRMTLFSHLQEFYRDRQEYNSLRGPNDPSLDPVDPELMSEAEDEIKLSIFDSIKDPKAKKEARESFLRRRSRLFFGP